ncbi:hypothetical protein MFLO_08432 [Listeria floridensis FSL S10-1187]|uniref:Uncharacterized protein n=1 Tax=Listeria floridensis FSL S10-1187 TaxID=1265817 RepID=A0ABN0RF62_9LIST|nr:hypothetical protein [Listeria floridensis]EUJ31818.1 hypothetical protein MFLO_08432 [Listeria floridensis FSL S10-1187]
MNTSLFQSYETIEGTCYVEFQMGEAKREFWDGASKYIDGEIFTLISFIFDSSNSHFSKFGRNRLTLIEMKRLKSELKKVNSAKLEQSIDLADTKLWTQMEAKTGKPPYSAIKELLEELIIWLDTALVKQQEIVILGI